MFFKLQAIHPSSTCPPPNNVNNAITIMDQVSTKNDNVRHHHMMVRKLLQGLLKVGTYPVHVTIDQDDRNRPRWPKQTKIYEDGPRKLFSRVPNTSKSYKIVQKLFRKLHPPAPVVCLVILSTNIAYWKSHQRAKQDNNSH